MVNGGDIGGVAGALIGGYGTVKYLGKATLYSTLGPAYAVGGTLLGLIAGRYIGSRLAGSSHLPAPH